MNKKYPDLVPPQEHFGNQVACGALDDRSFRPDFIDLRLYIDDKTPLANPHKGVCFTFDKDAFERGDYNSLAAPSLISFTVSPDAYDYLTEATQSAEIGFRICLDIACVSSADAEFFALLKSKYAALPVDYILLSGTPSTEHIDLCTRYFAQKFIICGNCECTDYASIRGIGGFDPALYTTAPVLSQASLNGDIPTHDERFKAGLYDIEKFRSSHSTVALYSGSPKLLTDNESYTLEYCINRLGYWYFISGLAMPLLTPTAHNVITLDVENRGWSRAYRKYTLKARLKGSNGDSFIIPLHCDNRKWLPDKKQTLSLALDCRALPAGEYDFAICMLDGDEPVRLAIKEELLDGGFYTLCKATVKSI